MLSLCGAPHPGLKRDATGPVNACDRWCVLDRNSTGNINRLTLRLKLSELAVLMGDVAVVEALLHHQSRKPASYWRAVRSGD